MFSMAFEFHVGLLKLVFSLIRNCSVKFYFFSEIHAFFLCNRSILNILILLSPSRRCLLIVSPPMIAYFNSEIQE